MQGPLKIVFSSLGRKHKHIRRMFQTELIDADISKILGMLQAN